MCGASSRFVQQWYHFGATAGLNTNFFKCKKCGRKSKEAKTKTEAIKLWNEAVKNNFGEEE